jgi:MFS transporter, DHA3 family, macrolide efflux protein
MEQTEKKYHPAIFFTIWSGQMISLLGSGMSEFALGVYLYEQTHSVIQFGLLYLFVFLPQIVIAPISGVIADRYNRRLIMILSNLCGALTTGLLAGMVLTNTFQVWLVYLISILFAICNTTLYPPYAASVPMLVPKEQLGRANGMVQLANSISRTLAPLVAGVLIVTIQLSGIALIDGITFLVALGTLLPIVIPQPDPAGKTRQPILKDAMAGLTYITARPGLLGLLTFFGLANISISYCSAIFTPLVLSFADSSALGVATAAGGAGMLAGAILMTLWGGPKPRIHGVLGFGILFGLFVSLVGIHASVLTIAIANGLLCFCIPIVNGSNMTIWQTKIPADLQGRAFSSLRLIAWSTVPLAYLTVGVLADRVFEPMFRPGGLLAGSIGTLIGVGPGRGMGFLLIIIGLFPIIAGIMGYLRPRVRLLEQEMPDPVVEQEVSSAAQA